MAAFNPISNLSLDVFSGNHAMTATGIVYKVALSNSLPLSSYTRFNQITELPAINGYAAGGGISTLTSSNAGATTTIFGTDVTFTAAGGDIGTFRYAVLYKFSPGASNTVRPLVGWWDYGVGQILHSGDKFIVDFNASQGFLQVS